MKFTMIEGLKLTSNTGIFEFLALSLSNIYFRKYQDSLVEKVENGILCFDCLFRRSFFMCILYDNFTPVIIFCFSMKIGIFVISVLYSNNNGNKLNSVPMR